MNRKEAATFDVPSRSKTSATVLAAALLLVALPMTAKAETTECKEIVSVPTVISEQGIWCAKKDLSVSITSGVAIEITVNNVTIDFNGFKLGGLAGGPESLATGVRATGRKNITIRGANIRGFFDGIVFDGGAGFLVEDSSFDQNIRTTIIAGQGLGQQPVEGAVIRRNRVISMAPGDLMVGILAGGTNISLEDNIIANLNSDTGTAFPFAFVGTSGAQIVGNTVNSISAPDSTAFYVSGSRDLTFERNKIVSPINLDSGIFVETIGGLEPSERLILRDNTFSNTADAIGSDDGSDPFILVGDNYLVDTP